MNHYQHVIGARLRDRAACYPLDGASILASCHRGLRGPYTGVDTVLTEVLPDAQLRWPELVDFHRRELLYGMPQFCTLIGPPTYELTEQGRYAERTRWYSASMVRCMSQGIITFLREYARRTVHAGRQLPTLIFDDVHNADPTVSEFIALFLRRTDSTLWPVIVGSNGTLAPELTRVLHARAEERTAPPLQDAEVGNANTYIESAGTTDDPTAYQAYLALTPEKRAALHDRRADALERAAVWGTQLGALPFHRERGSDPAGAGVAAIMRALECCSSIGFSAAVHELAERGLAIVDQQTDPENHRKISDLLIADLITARRLDEAARLCHEMRRNTASQVVQMNISYFFAMINTRFQSPRDHETAAEWQNNARAIAGGLSDERQRTVMIGFHDNGMALIEMHRGHLAEALRLVQTGIARLDRELVPADWIVHRSQLLYNEARLLALMKDTESAYAKFSELIDMDPLYTDYLSERAKIARRNGDFAAALADYDRAFEIGPPFPELFHNRGSLHREMGDDESALAEFELALDMEPDDKETLLSKAELLYDNEQMEAAESALRRALEQTPDDLRMICLRGMILLAKGETEQARADLDRTLATDPARPAALISRAAALFELSEPAAAATDLSAALELLGENSDLLFNRALAYTAQGNYLDALADLDRAAELPDADLAEIRQQREVCAEYSMS